MEDNKSKSKSFVLGAAVLGIAGLITKLLGAIFRIPLTNIIGASGMAYYQTAYPVYVMLLMISTSGLPTAISRMVAERRAQQQYYEAHRVFKVSFKLMSFLGIVTGVGIFCLAPAISRLQMEPDAVYAMRSIAPALLLCPIMSCFRGFFQGRRTMIPTAISQVAEQLFRVGLGLGLAYYLLRVDAAHAAAGASFGASAGAIFGLLAVVFVYFKKKGEIEGEFGEDRQAIKSEVALLKEILIIAVPVTLGASVMPILNGIDTLIVKRRLLALGYDAEVARTLFGELSGMAAPIINFPMVFSQAVCMSIVPVITDAWKRDDKEFVQYNAALGLRYALLVMLPCAFGMIVLSKPIMKLLYPRQVASAVSAAGCLAIYAVGMIFFSIIHTLTGILQGMGKQIIPVLNLCVGAVVKVVVTYTLTGVDFINVKGAAIGTVCAYFVAAILNYTAMKRYTHAKVDFNVTIVKPIIASAVMAAIAWLVYMAAVHNFGNAMSTLLAILAGMVVYAIMIFATRAITAEDLETIPKLRKLAGLFRKLKLVK
ncbi:MAG: polysaccharide biosynthesis protein [Clostridia bacterium]|nr:polysaccharide biosynthesis protein [Clostridia bacterium]